jgi:radical SAM superfamily enzyme YgiQ (UPF0313 family)
MNVFLIYVRDENFYQLLPEELGGSESDDGRVKVMAFPPLGIQTLAPVLRQHGHRVRLFDTCHPRMKTEHIVRACEEDRPEVIAISFLSATTYPTTRGLVKTLRGPAPGTPIIVGGPFASINATHVLKDCPEADCVGIGEGEELLPDYLEHLNDLRLVQGLVWRNGDEIICNQSRTVLGDLDQFPYPDRESLPIDYIEALPLDVPAVLSLDKFCSIQTSRGCPYSCIYCDIPSISNGRWRPRSVEHVLGEMQELSDMGYRSIYLTDDNFLLNRRRIQAICSGITERKLELRWGCEGRVDSVAVDQFAEMSAANCCFLAFGIEAGTQQVLDRLGKKQTLEQIERAVNESKRQGIGRVHGFFLIGSPGETKKDIMKSFRFAARLKLDTFSFNRLCVYRGTPLWQEYIDRGIIDDHRDWHKWFKCSDIDPSVLPSAVLNRARIKGYALLFIARVIGRPVQTFRLLGSFARYMKTADIFRLIYSPFRKRKLTRKSDLTARMVELGLEAPIRDIGVTSSEAKSG